MIGSVRPRRYTTRTAALRVSGTTAPRGAVPANPQLFPERQAMEISNNILVKIKLGYNQFTNFPTPAMSRKLLYTASAGRSRSRVIRNSR